ncbi:ABC transporter permease [Halalkalibacter alkaliphilus]|uniref:ABC transporter permease n=1 Tax=Halalkalibacter alkaliphilus TaxID=2917993 RepID=A0A9X1ZUJ4_9BACI|nr:ABC transporter permease [Halalkalibacter alkaliphilus]MCL7745764.1 ABC transporter permease [Halalkalibacter alkaliphilus]
MANTNMVVNESKTNKLREIPVTQLVLPIVIVLLVIFNIFVTNNFFAIQTLWNLLLLISTTALVAIGMTLVIATGGIDLSVGAIMAIAAVTSTFLLETNIFILVLGTLFVCMLFGLFNGAIISYIGVQPIIMTLAMMIAGRGIAQVLTDGYLVSFSNPSYEFIGRGSIASIPFPVIILFFVALTIYLVVKYTTFGRYVEAIGDNETAANLSGINVKRIKLMVYCIAAVLAALAGLIETSRLAAADATRIGELIELDAIAAVVVGGTLMTGGRPYIWGTVFGAILMGLITVTFIMNNIPYTYSLVIKAVIIIGAIYFQRKNR